MPCSWASSHIVAASTPPPRWAWSSASGSSRPKTGSTTALRRLLLDELLELAGLVHLGGDVAAADQLAVDEELRDRRPVRPGREVLPDPRVGQHVPRAVVGPDQVQDLDDLVAEAAAGHVGRALHVEEHAVVGDLALNLLEDLGVAHGEGVAHWASGARVRSARAWMVPSSM